MLISHIYVLGRFENRGRRLRYFRILDNGLELINLKPMRGNIINLLVTMLSRMSHRYKLVPAQYRECGEYGLLISYNRPFSTVRFVAPFHTMS